MASQSDRLQNFICNQHAGASMFMFTVKIDMLAASHEPLHLNLLLATTNISIAMFAPTIGAHVQPKLYQLRLTR